MNFLGAFFRSWLGWLVLLVCLRLIAALPGAKIQSIEAMTTDSLLTFLASEENQEKRKLGLRALYQIALNAPEERQRIIDSVRRHFPDKQAHEVRQFLHKIDNDPLVVLAQAIPIMTAPVFHKYLAQVMLGIVFISAVLLISVLPLIFAYFIGIRCLKRIFGSYSRWKLLLLNAILVILLPGFLYIDVPIILLHLLTVLAVVLAFHYLVQSVTLSVFLGINQMQSRKAFSILVVIMVLSFLVHYPSQSQVTKFSPSRLLAAIDKVATKRNQSATPLLMKILRQPAQFSPAIILHTIQAIQKIGDRDCLSVLQIYLNHQNTAIRQASLQAIVQILQN